MQSQHSQPHSIRSAGILTSDVIDKMINAALNNFHLVVGFTVPQIYDFVSKIDLYVFQQSLSGSETPAEITLAFLKAHGYHAEHGVFLRFLREIEMKAEQWEQKSHASREAYSAGLNKLERMQCQNRVANLVHFFVKKFLEAMMALAVSDSEFMAAAEKLLRFRDEIAMKARGISLRS